jgi:hypothetical protein
LDSDDLYADLVADVSGFEELMRVRIAATVSQSIREVEKGLLESWLNLQDSAFDHFVGSVCGWDVDGSKIKIPINKDNEAKGTVVRENVKFDRTYHDFILQDDLLTVYRICENSQESIRTTSMSEDERHVKRDGELCALAWQQDGRGHWRLGRLWDCIVGQRAYVMPKSAHTRRRSRAIRDEI